IPLHRWLATLSLHDALPILHASVLSGEGSDLNLPTEPRTVPGPAAGAGSYATLHHEPLMRRRRRPAQDLRLSIDCLPTETKQAIDRKSTRLNSSHQIISYAV